MPNQPDNPARHEASVAPEQAKPANDSPPTSTESEPGTPTGTNAPTDVRRYPDYLMDFPPDIDPDTAQRWQRFFELREDILLDYSYHTARAYWTDLQDIFEWAIQRNKDILNLTERDLTQYRALLRRRKYSENTIRRRMVTWNKFQARLEQDAGPQT
ncbi:site-specific integrase [Actinomyces sp. W5033]|uniref:site-specific integrase n=1 Tax=Actinomyces sp. W5033 TaxID=3446479 RepID=UPI003EDF09BA